MGKKLIIKGADFSENSAGKDQLWTVYATGTAEYTGSTYTINLPSTLSSGTLTKFTVVNNGSGNAAVGVKDTNNGLHYAYWEDVYAAGTTIITEKTLNYSIYGLVFWFAQSGGMITYKLEILD